LQSRRLKGKVNKIIYFALIFVFWYSPDWKLQLPRIKNLVYLG
jgi:hypothetical protein